MRPAPADDRVCAARPTPPSSAGRAGIIAHSAMRVMRASSAWWRAWARAVTYAHRPPVATISACTRWCGRSAPSSTAGSGRARASAVAAARTVWRTVSRWAATIGPISSRADSETVAYAASARATTTSATSSPR
ncbi:hypothetical protein [Nonomuraea sp. NPDC050202]|uniref:hypothetical protein n=1 Tax=Nonomuraea sp. NPDC050202 TaxID=3155035 RepID=UPI0033D4D97C